MEAIKKEQIYLDLSKLSGDEIKEAYSVLNNSYDDVSKSLDDMFKIGNHIKDIPLMSYNPYSESWMLYKKVVGKAEINLSEFRQLFSAREEVLQVENKINIDELSKLCDEYNRSNLNISILKRDLEYKNNWSEESVAIQEIKQQISISEKIKETAKSKLQDIGIEF